MYYPRQKGFVHCGRNFANPACAATYHNRTLDAMEETDRKFGSSSNQCEGKPAADGEDLSAESGTTSWSFKPTLMGLVIAAAIKFAVF